MAILKIEYVVLVTSNDGMKSENIFKTIPQADWFIKRARIGNISWEKIKRITYDKSGAE